MQIVCGGHIICSSRIRKKVTENRQTDREQTEKAITEATLIIDGSSG